MKNDFNIYMTTNGRISISGINEANVEIIALAMKKCIENYNWKNKNP